MLEESWKTDWAAFVEYVARAIERGETNTSLSADIGSQRVHWKGRVKDVQLNTEYASGVALRMEEVRRTLSSGATLLGRHLFLNVGDPEQKQRLKDLKPGDWLDFYSTIGKPSQVFQPLELASSADEKTLYMQIAMDGAEIA